MTRREMMGTSLASMLASALLGESTTASGTEPVLVDTGWQPKMCSASFGDEWERSLAAEVPPGFADRDWPRVDLTPPRGCVVIENCCHISPDGLSGIQRLRAVRIDHNTAPTKS